MRVERNFPTKENNPTGSPHLCCLGVKMGFVALLGFVADVERLACTYKLHAVSACPAMGG